VARACEPLTAPGVCPVLVGVSTVVVPVPEVADAIAVVAPVELLLVPPVPLVLLPTVPLVVPPVAPLVVAPLVEALLVVPPLVVTLVDPLAAVVERAGVPEPEVAAPLVPELPGVVPAPGLAGMAAVPETEGEPAVPDVTAAGAIRSASSSSGITISREGAHQAHALEGMISEKFLRDLALSAWDDEMTR
jgi:hypothetical protein